VYVVPAKLTTATVEGRPTVTGVRISFGSVIDIDVDLKPSGGTKSFDSTCSKDPVTYVPGSYEGSIEFHGEEGFTEVSATSAPVRPQGLVNLICLTEDVEERGGSHVHGAKLEAGTGGTGVRLQVNQNRPGGPTQVEATLLRSRNDALVARVLRLHAGGGIFSFDPKLRRARLSPGGPFSGQATFLRDAKPADRWSGDLEVDLPGRSNVPLTGGGFHATLEHSVRHVVGHGVLERAALSLLHAS
jgi:hypothetical protein